MKEILPDLLIQAINALKAQNILPADTTAPWQITIPKTKEHGDFACNIAMTLSKAAQKNPREIATLIVAHLPPNTAIKTIKIEGPGFINFFMNEAEFLEELKVILEKGAAFGRSNHGQQKSIQVEFVSANPTGPLHVGHGRGAAYGATLANLLREIGYQVQKEYYVNDAGRQMNILAASVWLRYLEKCGLSLIFPPNGYKGDYIQDIAATVYTEKGNLLCCTEETLKLIQAFSQQTDPNKIDEAIDQIIAIAQKQLGKDYSIVFNAGLHAIQADIDNDLQEFGVTYDCWYSEKSLEEKGLIKTVIEKLQINNYLYEKEGALWFRSTDFGDDKDRVVVRENGQATYFASDIAYHYEKYLRGFHHVINIWGADHHGYVPRVKAALTALGLDPSQLTVLLVQFAILYRGEERVQMSTRSGSFVTLRELRQEVGNDACRFFYVTRKAEQHMDFDLDLAKSETKDNPVYYIQYAHARIHSVHQKLLEQVPTWNWQDSVAHISHLQLDEEKSLIQKLSRYPSVLVDAARDYEPHQVALYLRELASLFHSYYNTHKVLTEDTLLCDARMCLSLAIKQVLFNGLILLGVSPAEKM